MNASNHNFFLLRRPLLSLETIFDFNEKVENGPILFEKHILDLYADPLLQQAIFLASKDVYYALQQLLAHTFQGNKRKLLQTLYKYLIRMSTRSTPFGLFAGITTGETGTSTEISFKKSGQIETKVMLDVAVSTMLTKHFIEKPYIACQLLYYPNSSLYLSANRYHYLKRLDAITGEFNLIEVYANRCLSLIIERARAGSKITDMADAIHKLKIPLEDAKKFVASLIEQQIIISELEISVFGEDPIRHLISRLKILSDTERDVKYLGHIRELLAGPLPINEKSERIEKALSDINIATGQKNLVKVDMHLNEEVCTLNQKAIDQVKSNFIDLLPLQAPRQNTDLSSFAHRFYDRYQDRQMPLLEVINHHTGIGYKGQVPVSYSDLDSVTNLEFSRIDNQKITRWSKLNQLRLHLYEQALGKNRMNIEITNQDLSEFKAAESTERIKSEGFYLFGSFLAKSSVSLDAGKLKFVLNAAGGPSAFNLMARFCNENHILEGLVSQCVGWEEFSDQESVFAEINHVPDCRTGNILSRPGLRKYEIPYLSGSQTKTENQILPCDLMVRVTSDFEVVLFSQRLKKRVIPRLTSAHQYTNSLPVYRFLSDIARSAQGPGFEWSWDYLSDRPFLPRIEYKHLVLSKATWNLSRSDIFRLDEIPSINQWKTFRENLKIPRYVQLVESDRLLLIDGESSVSVGLLFDALQNFEKIRLIEYLEKPGEGIVKDGDKHYGHEMIIPFLCETSQQKNPVRPITAKCTGRDRKFAPGSKWLYIKIYCNANVADQILITEIKQLTERLLDEKIIEKWFFVRYQDPDTHLRLRFYLNDATNGGTRILEVLNRQLILLQSTGIVYKIQIDTYERELERYNVINYNLAESIFCIESKAILELLSNSNCPDRWKIAITAIDILLEDLSFSIHHKKCFASRMQNYYFKEMKGDQTLLIQLNNKFRQHRPAIEAATNKNETEQNTIRKILESRTRLIRQRYKWKKVTSQHQKENLASSFIHMFLNRLFISNHRQQELVVYHFLKKSYESKHARDLKLV